MDVLSFETEVKQLIGLQQEGEYWDFKKEWHQNKADLLHDIICMANNLSNQDGLIIIGVDEENDYSICDVINDPKYSLQGTTQGNGLTGSIPPVRFSM